MRKLAENLKRLDEGPEQSADAFTTTEQLDKPHHSEQTEEVDADNCRPARLQQQQQHYKVLFNTASLVTTCYAEMLMMMMIIIIISSFNSSHTMVHARDIDVFVEV